MVGRVTASTLTGARSSTGLMLGVSVGVSLLVGALLGSLPARSVPFFASVVVLSLLAVSAMLRLELLIYFVILTSAPAGLLQTLDKVDLGNTTLSVSGLRWGYVLVVMAFIVLANFKKIRVPMYAVALAALPCWTSLTMITSGVGSVGLKDVLFYTAPFAMLVYCQHTLRATRGVTANHFEGALLASVLIPIAMYAILTPAGLVQLTEIGPVGLIGPRAVAIYLLIPLACGLARWRYAAGPKARTVAMTTSILALLTILFTLSRTASMVGLLLFGVSRLRPSRKFISSARTMAGIALAVAVLTLVPQFRERLFFGANPEFLGYVESFNTAGRNKTWPLTFERALERPVLGWGPGSSRLLVGELLSYKHTDAEYHPHNEYLQVFHDMGIVGILCLVGSWGTLLWRQSRRWKQADRDGDPVLAARSLAALLGIMALMLTSLTDNTFHYAFAVLPAILLVGIAEHQAEDRSAIRGSEQFEQG